MAMISGPDLYAEARRLETQGIAVFPCGEDKKPRTEHGLKDATTAEAAHRQWFTGLKAFPALGVPTGGKLN